MKQVGICNKAPENVELAEREHAFQASMHVVAYRGSLDLVDGQQQAGWAVSCNMDGLPLAVHTTSLRGSMSKKSICGKK